MEEALKKLLEDWEVAPRYVAKLKEEEVYDVDTLLCLKEEMIEAIFVKVGSRASFSDKLAALREEYSEVNLTVDELTYVARQIVEEIDNWAHCKQQQGHVGGSSSGNHEDSHSNQVGSPNGIPSNQEEISISVEGSPSTVGCLDGQGATTSNLETGIITCDTLMLPPANADEQSTFLYVDSNTGALAHPAAASSNLKAKKRPLEELESPLDPQNLDIDTLLKNCGGVKAKVLLAYYQQHNDFNENHRNFLADLILSEYLKDDSDRKLPDSAVGQITCKIMKRFPGEEKEEWNPSSVSSSREKAVG